jgi:hypothetical protein
MPEKKRYRKRLVVDFFVDAKDETTADEIVDRLVVDINRLIAQRGHKRAETPNG